MKGNNLMKGIAPKFKTFAHVKPIATHRLEKLFLNQVCGKELLPKYVKKLNNLIIIKDKKFKIRQKGKADTL